MAFVGPVMRNTRAQALQEQGMANILGGLQAYGKFKTQEQEGERARALKGFEIMQDLEKSGFEVTPEMKQQISSGDYSALTNLNKTPEYDRLKKRQQEMQEMEFLAKQKDLELKGADIGLKQAQAEELKAKPQQEMIKKQQEEVQKFKTGTDFREFFDISKRANNINNVVEKTKAGQANAYDRMGAAADFVRMLNPAMRDASNEEALSAEGKMALPERFRNMVDDFVAGKLSGKELIDLQSAASTRLGAYRQNAESSVRLYSDNPDVQQRFLQEISRIAPQQAMQRPQDQPQEEQQIQQQKIQTFPQDLEQEYQAYKQARKKGVVR